MPGHLWEKRNGRGCLWGKAPSAFWGRRIHQKGRSLTAPSLEKSSFLRAIRQRELRKAECGRASGSCACEHRFRTSPCRRSWRTRCSRCPCPRFAGMDHGAELTDKDIAGENGCPPKRFTPRRCALLSRPLRELPPAFLCAMRGSPYTSGLGFDSLHQNGGIVLTMALQLTGIIAGATS